MIKTAAPSKQQPVLTAPKFSSPTSSIIVHPNIGSVIKFGKYDWRVLDVQGNEALLLSDKVFTNKPYNKEYDKEYKDVTWEICTLRKWLNSEFLSDVFTSQEQSTIVFKTIPNENNQWFGTKGGNSTKDKIFLLSLSEVVKYFGDSGQLKNRPKKDVRRIDDQYNSARVATRANGATAWWWLRSPGIR